MKSVHKVVLAAIVARARGYVYISSVVKNYRATTYHHVVPISHVIAAGAWIPANKVIFPSGAHGRFGISTARLPEKCINKSEALALLH